MRFRQEQFMYAEMLVMAVVFGAVGLASPIITDLFWYIFIPMALTEIVLIPYLLLGFRRYMIIDEKGIRCENRGAMLWEYDWDEISKLRRLTINKSPGILIVPKDGCVKLKDQFNPVDGYFQYCSAAKKALRAYCTVEIEK